MSSSAIQKTRIINELTGFIKKLLQDPSVLETSLTIARQHLTSNNNDTHVLAAIANQISDTTSIHIPENPEEHSEADRLFLELLKEVVQEEQALY